MHKEITAVIPGAINEKQVESNASVTDMPEISEIMSKIKNIYEKFIKKDVHEKWN